MAAHTDVIPHHGLSIPGLYRERVSRTPSAPAYYYYDQQSLSWNSLSWLQAHERVSMWFKALSEEKLHRGDRVAIMLPNSPDWFCFDLASMALGLVVVPLYINDRPENVAYILEHTQAKVFICQSSFYHDKLLSLISPLDSLNRIVIADRSTEQSADPRATSLAEWLPDSGIDLPDKLPAAGDLATIVYTSGTTGRPKGVMLSHGNILGNSVAGLEAIPIFPTDLFLSFLPLSHMLERTAGYYLPMMAGAAVAYSRSIQDLTEDLATIKPTILVAVPKIFERLHSKLSVTISEQSALKQRLFSMARDIGWRQYQYQQHQGNWHVDLLLQPLLHRLVSRKVCARLGGKLRVVISGGAPLSYEVAKNLIGLGIKIYQGYGLTEASPIVSVNRIENNRPETVGSLLSGVQAKISDNGELLIRGPNVMLGYWQDAAATSKAIDNQGWLHTGDTGEMRDDCVCITGRLKDILVLSNGEKISPTDVETAIAADPLFEQNLVVGEGRPYLTLLAVLNPELWQQFAQKAGFSPDDLSLSDEKVRNLVLQRIEHCLRNFPGFAWIRDIHISNKPWTVDEGFLTPTLKLKRKNILSALQDDIERMYQT